MFGDLLMIEFLIRCTLHTCSVDVAYACMVFQIFWHGYDVSPAVSHEAPDFQIKDASGSPSF